MTNMIALAVLGVINLGLAAWNWQNWRTLGLRLSLVAAAVNAFAGVACLACIPFAP